MRPLRLLALLVLVAGPLAAQGTAADTAHWRATKADLDSIARDKTAPAYSKRAQLRIRVRDSLRTVVVPPKPDTTVIVVQPPKPDTTTTVTPPPVVVDSLSPAPLSLYGPATVAERPRAVPSAALPTTGRAVKVCATCSLQAALDAAVPGDILLLAPGATYVGNYVLRDKGTATAWITLRTDTTLQTVNGRMTPSLAQSQRLAKILTPSNVPALSTSLTAHHWIIDGVELSGTSAASDINGIVALGNGDRSVQTTLTQTAHDLIVSRSYIHGTPTQAVHRCVNLQSATTAIVDSWIADCHSNNGDSQAIVGWNGPGPYLIQNNHLEGGHQGVFFGGADPASQALVPSDITVRGNHITRPRTWAGTWQTKTIIETKDVRRLLIEGNVIENVWQDAQAGFAFLLKSENQLCTAPYTQTADVTVRYNVIRSVASGFNLAGNAGGCPSVTAARFLIQDNLIQSFDGTGDAIPVQLLGPTDVVVLHNTFLNASKSLEAVNFSGNATQRLAFDATVLYRGDYGFHMDNGAQLAPGAVWRSNAVIGGNVYPYSCSGFPVGTLCPGSVLTPWPLAFDARPIGVDQAKLDALTANVVVAP